MTYSCSPQPSCSFPGVHVADSRSQDDDIEDTLTLRLEEHKALVQSYTKGQKAATDLQLRSTTRLILGYD